MTVLLSITFSAQLWGRFLGVPPGSGGLSIRLPPLAVQNRHHSLLLCRSVGQDCILRGDLQSPPARRAGPRGHPTQAAA